LRVRVKGVVSIEVPTCDSLPRGLSVVSAAGFIVRGRTLCASVSRMLVLTSKRLRFTVRADQNPPPRITNIATARASNAPGVRARTTIHVAGLPPIGLG
jgi:hypothetical protein